MTLHFQLSEAVRKGRRALLPPELLSQKLKLYYSTEHMIVAHVQRRSLHSVLTLLALYPVIRQNPAPAVYIINQVTSPYQPPTCWQNASIYLKAYLAFFSINATQ